MPRVCFRQGKLPETTNDFVGGEASPTNRQPDRGSRFEATIIIRKIDDLKIVTELSPGPRVFGLSRTLQWEPGSDSCRTKRRNFPRLHLSKLAIAGLTPFTYSLSKPLPVFNRADERLDHFRVEVISVELVQLVQPEVIAGVI